ncbi:hypothetical protein NSERUTF1_1894 [Nocardia seriolae]|nr:hypothetical protein NSERUTF1_1894 [Nocardia seriolae]
MRLCGRCKDVVGREPNPVGPGGQACEQCIAEIREVNSTLWGGED